MIFECIPVVAYLDKGAFWVNETVNFCVVLDGVAFVSLDIVGVLGEGLLLQLEGCAVVQVVQ